MNHPTGTITFLFTDIEGSTTLWERCPEAMRLALARHDQLLRQAIERHHGYVFKTMGDAFCAAFQAAPQALNAALEAHLALSAYTWDQTGPIRVRMALHTGEAEERDNDYFGQTLNRTARLQGIAHGQQTLISQTTYDLVKSHLPDNTTLSDLGIHRLKDLATQEHVWQLLHPSLPQELPPLKSLNHLPTNLPIQITSFIGREREITVIKERLKQTRLLTLTGSGGCGKTRLALQMAVEVVEDYPQGVWLVELAPLSNSALVSQTVAEVLGIREAPGEPITKTLLSALKERNLLLVLDNCEHVLDASAHLVDTILKVCPKVSILVSSREALGISGESAYRVPSLSLPPPPSVPPHVEGQRGMTSESLLDYEAVRLFVERATAANSDFTLTSQNATSLASICHRLDGIPLAIELAAARVRSLSVEEINTRLDNRFRLLTGGSRTALPRQQTLRALIDWSYDLLNAQEKVLLCRLSVFAGGWTLEAAEFVCAEQGKGKREEGREGTNREEKGQAYPALQKSEGQSGSGALFPLPSSLFPDEILDLLSSLVDKSLVVYEEKEGKARYRLLETMRQYARDRLVETGEVEVVRKRHQGYFLALAEETAPKLAGADQARWLRCLEEEHENLRTALDWSLSEAESSGGLRLCGALQRFWSVRGHLLEGREWCERVLGRADAQQQTQERAKTLNGAGVLAWMQGDYAATRAYHQESLVIKRKFKDRKGIADSLNNLGVVAFCQGDYASARPYYEESLTLFREIDERSGIASSLGNLGNVAFCQGDNASAQPYYEECLTLFRETGDQHGVARSLNGLATMAYYQGDYASASTCVRESLTLFREIGDRSGIANSLDNLGNIAYSQGDNASARAYYKESLALQREIEDRQGIAYSLESFARLAARESNREQAVMLWRVVMTLREEIDSPLPPHERERYERDVAEARQALGQAAFSSAWAKGRTLTLEQAILWALEASGPESTE